MGLQIHTKCLAVFTGSETDDRCIQILDTIHMIYRLAADIQEVSYAI